MFFARGTLIRIITRIITHIMLGVPPKSCYVMSCPRSRDHASYGRFSEISSFFVGPRPWHIEIRHRVKNTSTIDLFGFETLKLRIRRLKLWKPTARDHASCAASRVLRVYALLSFLFHSLIIIIIIIIIIISIPSPGPGGRLLLLLLSLCLFYLLLVSQFRYSFYYLSLFNY